MDYKSKFQHSSSFNIYVIFTLQLLDMAIQNQSKDQQYFRAYAADPCTQLQDQEQDLHSTPLQEIDQARYCGIVSMMFEVRFIHASRHIFPLLAQFQEMDRLELEKRTKFLAKKYLDRYLSLKPHIQEHSILLLVITCMRVATKFNEAQSVSSLYTMQVCLSQADYIYQIDQFLLFEQNFIFALQFKLQMITPFDIDTTPYNLNQVQIQLLTEVINFSLTIPSISVLDPHDIFYSCLLYVQKQKPGSLDLQLVEGSKHTQNCQLIQQYLRKAEQ